MSAPGKLVVIATPIGNLGDLSPRAADALRDAHVVVCEDTRRTATLLRHVGSGARLLAADQHREERRVDEVTELVRSGRAVALVTDAGAPAVSDPGGRLVAAVADAGLPVEVLPGPSAVTTALAAAGLPADRFVFLGFLPRKPGERRSALDRVDALGWTVVALESPQRLATTLAELAERDPARLVVVCRELTKLHEEVVRGPAAEVAETIGARPRGEVTLVLAPASDRGGEDDPARLEHALAAMLEAGLTASGATDLAVRLGLGRRNAVYEAAVALARRERT